MRKISVFLMSLILVTITIACGNPTGTNNGPNLGTTGAALRMDIDGGKDVGGMRFTINRVSCNGEQVPSFNISFDNDLEDLRLPGMIPGFENKPFDKKSGHLFADKFVALAEGCYDVTVQPLTKDGKVSSDCSPATQKKVKINDGKTTEILLVTQCKNEGRGGLDTVAALNHEPELKVNGFTYNPSKFAFECEEVTICATVTDPDNDPLEFVWTQVSGAKLHGTIQVVSTTKKGKDTTQCIKVSPRFTGNYKFKVEVYDQVRDKNGKLIRIEDYLKNSGNAKRSHDELEFPIYVNWDVELQCYDKTNKSYKHLDGVRTIKRPATCKYTTPAEFYCNPKYVDPAKYCPNGKFDPTTVYPACK
jgi:hypothetical protein